MSTELVAIERIIIGKGEKGAGVPVFRSWYLPARQE